MWALGSNTTGSFGSDIGALRANAGTAIFAFTWDKDLLMLALWQNSYSGIGTRAADNYCDLHRTEVSSTSP